MNAVPGAYEDGPANWAPRVIPPSINDPSPLQQIAAGPTTIATAIDATAKATATATVSTARRVAATTVMLADRPFAEILAARERQLQMIDTGGGFLWWGVVLALTVAIVVVLWILVLRMRTKSEPEE